jgi:hypothetical protein
MEQMWEERTPWGREDPRECPRVNYQVKSTSSALHSFEGTSLIRLVLHIINNIQNETHYKT